MKKYLYLSFGVLLLFIACNTPDDITEAPIVEQTETLTNPVNDFVWRAMNSDYFWQKDVPELADSKKTPQNKYFEYLNGYADPEDLFNSLIFEDGITDRFSGFLDDYNVYNASSRGVSDSFGFDFGLVRLCDTCDEVLGFISYVVAESPASDAGLKRGDLFYSFNGTVLTIDNYTVVNAYYTDPNITLGLATIVNDEIVPINDPVELALRVVIENPIYYKDVITNGQGKKIGYLVYNAFNYTYHNELNDAFGEFKNENIEELILDLRYNGGGRGLTASFLASMIFGQASTEEIFAKLIYNNKNSDSNSIYPFFDIAFIYNKDGEYSGNDVPINRLTNLTKLYVITSDDTASASELIINGLLPYMEVIKVGTTTYGKNVGSYTMYDSPDFSQNGVNPNHTMALQPITSKAFNKLDQSDYTQGFEPDHLVIDYISQMKEFGDLEETLLNATLNIISGSVSKVTDLKRIDESHEVLFKSLDKKPFSKELIVEPF